MKTDYRKALCDRATEAREAQRDATPLTPLQYKNRQSMQRWQERYARTQR